MSFLRHQALYLPALAVLISLLFSTLTRIGLLVVAWPGVDHGIGGLIGIFGHGFVGDLLFALALGGFLLFFTGLTHTGKPLHAVFRAKRAVAVFALSAFLLFVAISEFVFWNEFGARYNFVAVDYLIYTNEVIGNIRESYSLPLLLGGMAVGAGLLSMLIFRRWPLAPAPAFGLLRRFTLAVLGAALFWVVGGWSLNYAAKATSANHYNLELAHNGPASFFRAARENELDFNRYYRTLPEPQYSALAPKWPDPARDIPNPNPLAPKHVVVIEMESLSASFMQAYGSEKDNITPNLDRLTGESIWFSDLYATGTRTVRGLEGLSVALPPLPGQSIVRREHNDHLYTLGSMLRKNDFEPMFLYGGYGAFDNMNAFFRANGYRISDRENFTEANQNFATIWGVADELLFNEALDQLERDSASNRKRFLHIMTTSNHRPYVYPEGHIDIPSKTGRNGAVKYTDWAIGDFLARAARRPWFKDTLFIIVADHNASVAGKQSLPPNKYRIPAMLYWPAKLAPRRIEVMASQIDLPPTVLALLGIRTRGVFFGQNLLGPAPEARAFLVNYQELGYLTPTADGNRQLIVLGPKKRVETFAVDAEGELARVSGRRAEEDRAVALFQKANEIFTSGKLHPPKP